MDLSEYREKQGLTQTEVAEQSQEILEVRGITRQTVSNLERGVHDQPNESTVHTIAYILGTDEDHIRQLISDGEGVV